jgi:hypothetical protein
VYTDVGECLGEEGGIYCGGGIPILNRLARGSRCVWDSAGWLLRMDGYCSTDSVGGIRTDHLDSKSHLHG